MASRYSEVYLNICWKDKIILAYCIHHTHGSLLRIRGIFDGVCPSNSDGERHDCCFHIILIIPPQSSDIFIVVVIISSVQYRLVYDGAQFLRGMVHINFMEEYWYLKILWRRRRRGRRMNNNERDGGIWYEDSWNISYVIEWTPKTGGGSVGYNNRDDDLPACLLVGSNRSGWFGPDIINDTIKGHQKVSLEVATGVEE